MIVNHSIKSTSIEKILKIRIVEESHVDEMVDLESRKPQKMNLEHQESQGILGMASPNSVGADNIPNNRQASETEMNRAERRRAGGI